MSLRNLTLYEIGFLQNLISNEIGWPCFLAKENHKKAEVVSALDQLEAESDDDDESDDGQGFLDNLMNDDAKPKKVDMDEEDEPDGVVESRA